MLGASMKVLNASVKVLAAGLVLTMSGSAAAQTLKVSFDCTQLTTRSTMVEKELCRDPELLRLNNDVDPLTERLEAALTGTNRELLLDTERPFRTERNGCSNESTSGSGYAQRVQACVRRLLTERTAALQAAVSSPDSMRGEVTHYNQIDPVFFHKYGEEFVGRRVSVVGVMVLAPNRSTDARTAGEIRPGATDRPSAPVPVRFKSMNEAEARFLDDKEPFSWWSGTVERRDGRLDLYLEDVLGAPLK